MTPVVMQTNERKAKRIMNRDVNIGFCELHVYTLVAPRSFWYNISRRYPRIIVVEYSTILSSLSSERTTLRIF